MLRKGKINLRKAKILGMYAIYLSTARPKWRQTPVTAYIGLYQELNPNKLQKVAEIACTPCIPEIDRKITAPKHYTWDSK